MWVTTVFWWFDPSSAPEKSSSTRPRSGGSSDPGDAQLAQMIGLEGVAAKRQSAARQGRGEHPSGDEQPHVDTAGGGLGELSSEREVVGVVGGAAPQVDVRIDLEAGGQDRVARPGLAELLVDLGVVPLSVDEREPLRVGDVGRGVDRLREVLRDQAGKFVGVGSTGSTVIVRHDRTVAHAALRRPGGRRRR